MQSPDPLAILGAIMSFRDTSAHIKASVDKMSQHRRRTRDFADDVVQDLNALLNFYLPRREMIARLAYKEVNREEGGNGNGMTELWWALESVRRQLTYVSERCQHLLDLEARDSTSRPTIPTIATSNALNTINRALPLTSPNTPAAENTSPQHPPTPNTTSKKPPVKKLTTKERILRAFRRWQDADKIETEIVRLKELVRGCYARFMICTSARTEVLLCQSRLLQPYLYSRFGVDRGFMRLGVEEGSESLMNGRRLGNSAENAGQSYQIDGMGMGSIGGLPSVASASTFLASTARDHQFEVPEPSRVPRHHRELFPHFNGASTEQYRPQTFHPHLSPHSYSRMRRSQWATSNLNIVHALADEQSSAHIEEVEVSADADSDSDSEIDADAAETNVGGPNYAACSSRDGINDNPRDLDFLTESSPSGSRNSSEQAVVGDPVPDNERNRYVECGIAI